MGFYVDLEMPKDCPMCPFANYDIFNTFCGCDITRGKRWAVKNDKDYAESSTRPDWCPLIEVPEPHGRLIDADALVEDLKRQCEEVFKIDAVSPDDFWITRDQAYNERLWKTWCESFFEYLKTRETIIPASEEGET